MPTAIRSFSRSTPPDKPLPQNSEAEKSVLGAILLDSHALKEAAEILNSGDFFHPSNSDLSVNGRIFLTMLRLEKEQKPIDLVTVVDHLHADGELAAYVASLGSGIPRASNVKHYAKMVREKALLRAVIYKCDDLERRAWDGGTPVADLYNEFELFSKSATTARAGHKPVDLPELCTMALSPRTFILHPILPVKSIAMIYSWRGSGKTFFLLELTYSIAVGAGNAFCWDIPEARPVLYVDGEMDSTELQERGRGIVTAHEGKLPDPGMMRFITPDLEEHTPEIITPDGRRRIEDQLKGGELLILDNLSSLIPSGEERETEDWAIVQEWLLKLRRCGYTTMFAHHAGKGGGQRGTSNREDVLNLVINLRKPQDYTPEDGLRAEVHFEKIRGRAAGPSVQPFEIKLETDEHGRACWTRKPLKLMLERQVLEMLTAKEKDRDIAEVMHLTRYQVYRLRKKYERGQLAKDEEN
jgi:hypothetical protein